MKSSNMIILKEIDGRYEMQLGGEWLFYMKDSLGIPMEIAINFFNDYWQKFTIEDKVRIWANLFSKKRPDLWRKFLNEIKN